MKKWKKQEKIKFCSVCELSESVKVGNVLSIVGKNRIIWKQLTSSTFNNREDSINQLKDVNFQL